MLDGFNISLDTKAWMHSNLVFYVLSNRKNASKEAVQKPAEARKHPHPTQAFNTYCASCGVIIIG